MKKLLLFLMLHTVQLFAAPPATVTVASTYYNADGSTFSGSMRITSPPFKCAGVNVAGVDRTYTISSGVVSVPLVPNIGCVGTVGYTVRYTVGLVSTTRYWSIPETPSTTSIDAVESSVQPSLGLYISLANMPFGNVAAGQVLGRSLDGKSWIGYSAVGEAVIAPGTINQYWRGDKTWQAFPTVPTNTSQLPELTNLYFTNARVLSAMSGLYVPPARTVAGKALSADISLVKADVGLGNVDNTSDANKPVSTAQQTALDLKASLSALDKTLVGLGNVDNTADANKPVSTPQQTALDLKANLVSPTFTGNFDSSGATTTKPIKTGTTLPVSCATGEVFFKTNEVAGNNVYTCLSSVWSVISSGEVATAGDGLIKVASEFSVDDTQFLGYQLFNGVPTGVGAVGAAAINTTNHSFYLGTGSGWELVTATASVTPGLIACNLYLTSASLAATWGTLSISSGLTYACAGSTITVGIDSAVVATKGANNTWTGKKIVTPTDEQTLTAGTAIVAGQLVEVSAASDITLTGTPTVADGSPGEYMTILNVGTTKITVQDETTLTGSNLYLSGNANFELKAKNAMQLVFSGSAGGWMQVGGGGSSAACSARPVGAMYGNTIGSYYGVTIGSLYCL